MRVLQEGTRKRIVEINLGAGASLQNAGLLLRQKELGQNVFSGFRT